MEKDQATFPRSRSCLPGLHVKGLLVPGGESLRVVLAKPPYANCLLRNNNTYIHSYQKLRKLLRQAHVLCTHTDLNLEAGIDVDSQVWLWVCLTLTLEKGRSLGCLATSLLETSEF